jgi:hypothetical protein
MIQLIQDPIGELDLGSTGSGRDLLAWSGREVGMKSRYLLLLLLVSAVTRFYNDLLFRATHVYIVERGLGWHIKTLPIHGLLHPRGDAEEAETCCRVSSIA